MDAWTTLITTVGFPITCVIGLAIFMAKVLVEINNSNKEREKETRELLIKAQLTVDTALETNAKFIDQLQVMQNSIDKITDDVEDIKSQLSK